MSYLPSDDYDYETPPEVIYNYKVTIHIIFTEPFVVELDSMDLYYLINDFREGKIIHIKNLSINPHHIRFIEVNKVDGVN
jgi:hypothetical protein